MPTRDGLHIGGTASTAAGTSAGIGSFVQGAAADSMSCQERTPSPEKTVGARMKPTSLKWPLLLLALPGRLSESNSIEGGRALQNLRFRKTQDVTRDEFNTLANTSAWRKTRTLRHSSIGSWSAMRTVAIRIYRPRSFHLSPLPLA